MLLLNGDCAVLSGGCPNGTTFHQPTQQCVNTTTGGVLLSLSVTFTSPSEDSVVVELNFSRDLDTSSFDRAAFQTISYANARVTDRNFNFSYSWVSPSSYTITLVPQTYIIMRDLAITVTTMSAPDPLHSSQDGMPFNLNCYEQSASLTNWTLVRTKSLS